MNLILQRYFYTFEPQWIFKSLTCHKMNGSEKHYRLQLSINADLIGFLRSRDPHTISTLTFLAFVLENPWKLKEFAFQTSVKMRSLSLNFSQTYFGFSNMGLRIESFQCYSHIVEISWIFYQILREINFGNLEVKNLSFTHLEAVNYNFCEFLHCLKTES